MKLLILFLISFVRLESHGLDMTYTLGSLAGPYSSLADAIQRMEGYAPGTKAYQNNNPGNLIYVGQAGATKSPDGFAVFSNYEAGRNALENQLGLYASRGLTLDQMTHIYAPVGHGNNNPDAYTQFLASQLGVDPNTLLSSLPSGETSNENSPEGYPGGSDSSILSPDSSVFPAITPTAEVVLTAALLFAAAYVLA